MKSIRASIKNWQKYNPRTDRKKHSWFRVEQSVFQAEDLHGLKLEHKWVWITFLCLASIKHNEGDFDVQIDWLSSVSGIPEETLIEATLELMKKPKLGTFEIIDGNQAVTTGNQSVSPGSTTDVRTDGRTDGDEPDKTKREHPLLRIWNENRRELPRAISLSKTRKSHADARLLEMPDLEYWVDIVERIAKSDFCNGKNERGWIADFDFFIKPDTHIRVLEGKYQSKQKKHNSTGIDMNL